ncbi:MAG: hypothetical protein OXF73_10460 [Gammaproteobacteria bacterium]|nr:hypothetical protein [Gammaproteobacteria bacterium]MCY4227654.1 hypothetical protein [Gammaproteobacteria bacterium]
MNQKISTLMGFEKKHAIREYNTLYAHDFIWRKHDGQEKPESPAYKSSS